MVRTPMRPEKGYVNSNGVKLYYEVEGIGDPLILLNGGRVSRMNTSKKYARFQNARD